MNKITLIFNRKERNLWIVIDSIKTSAIWNVDGVEKAKYRDFYAVKRNHKTVGLIWDVTDVKEEW